MNEEQKQQFYKDEYNGAPLREHMTFRCTSPLMRFIRIKSMEEGRDASAVRASSKKRSIAYLLVIHRYTKQG